MPAETSWSRRLVGGVRSGAGSDRFERVGVRAIAMQTTATPADAALLLADAGGARTDHRGRAAGHASRSSSTARATGWAAATSPGSRSVPRLVDATAVPMLYSGQLRARHAYLVLLIGLIAVARGDRDHRMWATSGRSTCATRSTRSSASSAGGSRDPLAGRTPSRWSPCSWPWPPASPSGPDR